MPFYSLRHELFIGPTISRGYWTAFLLGGRVNSPIFGYAADMFHEYLRREGLQIDYFLIDYGLAYGHDHFPWFRALTDVVPTDNPNMSALSRGMCAGDRAEVARALEDPNQLFYKNSYKVKLRLYPSDVLAGETRPDQS